MKGMEMDLEVEFSPGTSSLLKGIFGRGGRRGGGGDEDEVLEKGVKGGGKKLKVPKAMTRKRTSGGGGGGEEQEAEKRIEDVLADYSELPAAKGGDLDGGRRLSAPKAAVRKRTSGGGGSAVVGDGAGAAEKVGRAHVEGGEEEASKEVEEEEVDMEFEDIDEIVSPEPTKRRRISKETGAMPAARIPEVRRNKTTVDGKEERARKAAEKAAEREAAKETKRIEREAKLLEKQREAELATVNKLKTSKKESVKEMIVDISSPFSESPAGLQLVRFLETQECQSTKDWVSPVPNVVKWRRKVTAELDEELGHYVPVRLKMKDEKHILVVLKGEEFVDMGEELDNHVRKIKTILGDSHVKPIYLIEGLNALLRKSKNAKNRNFQGAVRQAIGSGEAGSAPKRAARRKSGTRDYTAIDEDVVEDALLNLQITHGCLIHHTATMQETSEWISVFTRDISYIPYKERMDFGLSFCTDVGQVKTGVDSEDTFFRMLQEINRVTAGVANGIMHEHKTVGELVAALKIGGEEALADLPMMANKMGVSTGRAIGSATSKRIYRIFMGQDPFSADV
ncbi:ERCC4 domain-containing protein [Peziza echinospora]|nr:ERCC4 domain-containing protein [Peziza echinospora]